MHDKDIEKVIHILKEELNKRKLPLVAEFADKGINPFKILISTILSLRTKDEVTELATERLFALASTPHEMIKLSEEEIIKAIYPVGFYRNKAKNILNICKELIEKYNSRVPETMNQLLAFKGVGRKTANLVVTLAFGGKGICVDTHVHRISNRLGYVKTKNPMKTEFALREKLPQKFWVIYNTIMVSFGKSICCPVSPFCSKCPVFNYCDRVAVKKSR